MRKRAAKLRHPQTCSKNTGYFFVKEEKMTKQVYPLAVGRSSIGPLVGRWSSVGCQSVGQLSVAGWSGRSSVCRSEISFLPVTFFLSYDAQDRPQVIPCRLGCNAGPTYHKANVMPT